MALTLPDIKNALRIDIDGDDTLLTMFMNGAVQDIKTSIGDENDGMDSFWAENPLFDTAVIMLTDAYYKNRSATTDASNRQQVVEYPLGVTSMILKLKGSYLKAMAEKPPTAPLGLAATDLKPTSVNLGWY